MPTPQAFPGPRDTRPSRLSEPAIEDLLEGPLELTVSRTGMRGMRTFFVPDVSGAGVRVLAAALQAPNMPRVDIDAWPGIESLLCTGLTVRPSNDPPDFEVVASYGFPVVGGGPFNNPPDDLARPKLQLDSTVVMKRTNKDIHGNRMHIDNYFPVAYDDDGRPVGTSNKMAPEQGVMVEVPVVIDVIRFSRREPPVDSRGRGILTKQRRFAGAMNKFQLGDDAPHMLLCKGIVASSDDNDESFNVTYIIERNPDTWDPTVVYVDPRTGQPGDNIELGAGNIGNGWRKYEVTKEDDLSELDLYL